MKLLRVSYLLVLGMLLLSQGLCAQDQVAELPTLDDATRLEVQQRLNQFSEKMERIYKGFGE